MGFALVGVVVASLHAAKVGAKCMHLYGGPESTRFKATVHFLLGILVLTLHTHIE